MGVADVLPVLNALAADVANSRHEFLQCEERASLLDPTLPPQRFGPFRSATLRSRPVRFAPFDEGDLHGAAPRLEPKIEPHAARIPLPFS